MISNLSGGTGSGIGSSIVAKIESEFKKKDILNFCFLSQPNIHGNLSVTPYNMAHALSKGSQSSCSSNVLISNERLNDICVKYKNIEAPSLNDLNSMAVPCLSGVTSSIRFPAVTSYGASESIDLPKLIASVESRAN